MKQLIEKGKGNLTVKEYISHNIPGLSRRILISLKQKEDGILVNGTRVTVRHVLHEGDELSLALEDTQSSRFPPALTEPDVIYEDDDLIAVNKPAGMPTHPSHGHYEDSLANTLIYYYQKQNRPFVFRGINRLDGVTSGIVLIAKNHLAAARLSSAMAQGFFEKHYTALVEGILQPEEGKIEQNIKRKLPSIIERTVCSSAEGESALTTYRVIKHYPDKTLVDAFPHTGRTHQLRVHFSSIGHPIVGDFLYGTENPEFPGRIALHCSSLTFPHPTTGKNLTLTASLPPAFLTLMQDFSSLTFQKKEMGL